MNRAELRAEVMAHQVAPNAYTGRVNDLLNEAVRRVARLIQWYGTETEQTLATTGGQSTYAWPADFGKLRYIRNTADGGTLRKVALRTLDEAQPSQGVPHSYALTGAAVVLYPTPSSAVALSLRYWALPAMMASDTDVPGLPEDYHRILPLWALKRSFEVEDDLEMAAYWNNEWERALRELEVDVRFPTDDGPRQVADMWGF